MINNKINVIISLLEGEIMKKETVNLIFNSSEVPNRAVAHSIETDEMQELTKELVIQKLTELKNQYSNISCKLKNRTSSSTFIFKFQSENKENVVRVIIDNDDPYYNQLSNISNLYEVKKKYKRLKIIALTTGLVLIAANPSVQKHASNFVKYAIEKDNENFTKEAEMNKLESLIMRLQLQGLSRKEYYELRDLVSKYKNELEAPENYEQIINENQEKIR